VLASGVIATAERTFSVNGATLGPEPGTVRAGPGALKPTAVRLARPRPTREALPPRVSGRVGRVMSGFVADRALAGSTVRLQARRAAGAPWVTVDRSRARADGRFVLNWVPKARFHLLRVALVPPEGYAPGASAVPRPPISDCHVTNREPGWIITCRTTAKAGSTARLLMSDHVVDRSKVRRGTIRLHGEGKVIAHHIDLVTARDHHMTLNL
jgi:hypothetical protein